MDSSIDIETLYSRKTISVVFLLSIAAAWFGDRWAGVAIQSKDFFGALFGKALIQVWPEILIHPLALHRDVASMLTALALFCGVWCMYVYILQQNRFFRRGQEYGSGRMGTLKEGKRYRADDASKNIILSKNLAFAIEPQNEVAKLPNNNVIVVGTSGSNKTVGYVEPNVLQMGDRDEVVIDPKGSTLKRCGHQLVRAGVNVVVFDTVHPERSDHWNMFANIRSHQDIVTFVECLVANTNGGKASSDPIWDNGEKLLYQACMTLLFDWFPKEDFTMKNLIRLLDMCEIADEEGSGRDRKCPLDILFEQISTGTKPSPYKSNSATVEWRAVRDAPQPQRCPTKLVRRDGVRPGPHGLKINDDPALKLWHRFRVGAGKTLKSFLISAHTRLAPFTEADILKLLAGDDGRDDLHLEKLGQGEQRRVIFVITSDFDGALNALLSLLVWQMIFLPLRAAEHYPGDTLPHPVQLIIDEFRNVGKIPSIIQCVAVVRSRNIGISIILQSLSQLEATYDKQDAETIKMCCATMVYLAGGRDLSTAKELSEIIGKQTIDHFHWSRNGAGVGATSSRSDEVLGRDVMTPDEILHMPASDALVLMGTEHVIEDKKSVVWEHPAYDPIYMFDPKHPPCAADGTSLAKSFDF